MYLDRVHVAKKIGLGLTGLVGLAVLIYTGEALRGKSAWENFKKEWEAKGEMFDYKQIIPKPIPSEKNFAHIPLLKPLHEHKWNKDLTESTPIDQKKFYQAESLLKIEGDSRPDLDGWKTGQPVDLIAWQKFFREEKDWPNPEKAGKPATDILQALTKFEATMTELTLAAKERPLCRYDIKYEAHFAALVPHLGPLRNFIRSFTLRALAHLANDDPKAALADTRMCLFLAESIRDEPLLISQLVRIACLQIATQPVWEGLKDGKWNAEQLAEIEKQLAKINLLDGYRISILGERDLANLAIDRMRDNPKLFDKLFEDDDPNLKFISDGWLSHNQKRLNEMHVNFSQRIVDIKARRIRPEIATAFIQELDARTKRKLPIYDMLSAILLPSIDKVAIKIGFTQTAVDHARIACHLELHKLKHKLYPAKLTGLEAPLPHDPYTGKPYVYTPNPKRSYQLYGVGWNQKNDDSKVILKDNDRLDLSEGDLVWSYLPTTQPKGE
ncbi:hypothetical protein OAK45_06345 [Verrucomicrobia bacterium]|nr:hypothetical protein [Verrucomicrobiota bacterium]